MTTGRRSIKFHAIMFVDILSAALTIIGVTALIAITGAALFGAAVMWAARRQRKKPHD